MITVLIASIVGAVAYTTGKQRGKDEMYYLCKSAEQAKREFFSSISLN